MAERVTVYLPSNAVKALEKLCEERGLTRSGVLRQALGVLQVMHAATQDGSHIGITRDRSALDTLIVSP